MRDISSSLAGRPLAQFSDMAAASRKPFLGTLQQRHLHRIPRVPDTVANEVSGKR
ncbi:hypothetical protein ACUSIJ_10635 [Pseudochelatococcus sp. B33]